MTIKAERGKNQQRGVYFLANDSVFDMTVAFLNSFRKYNTELALCLVPFDSKFESIASLAEEYRFDVFSDSWLLEECDRISLQFHGMVKGAYRKICCWAGSFSEFAYVDVDTVVQDNLGFAFEQLQQAEIVTSSSNIRENRRYVWKDSIERAGVLTQAQIEFSANTGFFVAKRNALSIPWIREQVADALVLSQHMELACMEQAFLNYLFVRSGARISSIYSLVKSGESPELPLEFWGGSTKGAMCGEKLSFHSGHPVFLVHWAGGWRTKQTLKDLPNKEIWLVHRNANPKVQKYADS